MHLGTKTNDLVKTGYRGVSKMVLIIFPPSYVQSACKIFKAAEECRLDRDEERSYVLYMKYLTVYDIIKKRPDFKQHLVCVVIIKICVDYLKCS